MERELDYGRLTKNAESMRAEEGIDIRQCQGYNVTDIQGVYVAPHSG